MNASQTLFSFYIFVFSLPWNTSLSHPVIDVDASATLGLISVNYFFALYEIQFLSTQFYFNFSFFSEYSQKDINK